jgi:CubicO group peptidase (beta-lactamase class C family)
MKDGGHFMAYKQRIACATLTTFVLIILNQYPAQCIQAEEGKSALPRSTPEAQGISSAAILAFVEEAEKKIDHLHSFMIVRHGHVVAEGWWGPYDSAARHELYSLSKSFTSTAVGLAIADGKLSIDDPVLKFFPDDAPPNPSANLKAMRVRDLLCMSTGHQVAPRPETSNESWVKYFLAQPVPFKPGTHFVYNTAATYMQSAIVQKVTGQTVLDFLRPRLFEPLGIGNPTWGTSPQGITLGGYGLNIRTEDIAKFGQMLLHHGQWQGRQLVPSEWVAVATARQTSNGSNPESDWEQGYGYQFWRARHGAFRGDGAFGQFCVVMPEKDAVVAITSGTPNMQGVLNLVWDKLLPAMQNDPLPPDDAGLQKLQAILGRLTIPPIKGSASEQILDHISGELFHFASNSQKLDALGLGLTKHADSETALILKSSGGKKQVITCRNGEWQKCRVAYGGLPRLSSGALPDEPAAVSGAWTAPDTFTVKICFYETPFLVTSTLKFSEGKLFYDASWNVSFGPTKPGQLVGEKK